MQLREAEQAQNSAFLSPPADPGSDPGQASESRPEARTIENPGFRLSHE